MAMANLQFPRIEYEFDVAMLMVMNTLRRTTIALLLSGLHDTTTKQPLSGLVIDFISFDFIFFTQNKNSKDRPRQIYAAIGLPG